MVEKAIESNEILNMNHITKDFSGIKALDNIKIVVQKGEIHALCGENGAGKSTLMKVLSGIYPYGTYTGEIYFNGNILKNRNIKDSENKGISIIHQELNLVDELSIMENIFLGNFIVKNGIVDFYTMYQKTKELLQELKMDISPEILVKELGIGHKQLVEIAKALSKESKLIIFDEPTASLTEKESEILLNIIKDLKEKNITSIYISHKLEEVLKISDSITVIRDGKFIECKKTSEYTKNEIVKAMVGRELNSFYPQKNNKIGEVLFEVKNYNVFDKNKKHVVKNVNLKLKKGEILGISGLIGSGRTELISSIFGTYEGFSEGDYYFDGKKINLKSIKEALKIGISMLPEDRKKDGIIAEMSVGKNMTLSNLDKYKRRFNYIDLCSEDKDIKEYISKIKIKTVNEEIKIKNLSGGNQQKVVLAKNLLVNPRIIFLDEPTRGIDVNAKYEIYKNIVGLAEQGISIIMVSSELPEILGISDRIIVMHEGEIKGEFINENITQEIIMEASIVGGKNESIFK
ncbi:xylose ABC transporter ATP-binding protein [Oceanivirga salmonicida]|uniref:xylose ABC transporter ATP-binding protein n=1 Tax=Oceanivirga salmonicida TaxID=1769291 RepID=UPI0012E2006A|nr:xylose ABC transporter ATP-binding protein [Oceanivirga salmonicida]